MYSSQIQRILIRDQQTSRYFTGVFPSDELPPICKDTALIANTDTHDKEGTHWIAMYIQDEETLEFFDSFGFHPSVYVPFISQYAKQFLNIKWNQTTFQSPTSNVCGQYCTYFILKRCNGFSMDCILNQMERSKITDFQMYYFFKKRYAVNMIFRK